MKKTMRVFLALGLLFAVRAETGALGTRNTVDTIEDQKYIRLKIEN
jgi:hypothetical protein